MQETHQLTYGAPSQHSVEISAANLIRHDDVSTLLDQCQTLIEDRANALDALGDSFLRLKNCLQGTVNSPAAATAPANSQNFDSDRIQLLWRHGEIEAAEQQFGKLLEVPCGNQESHYTQQWHTQFLLACLALDTGNSLTSRSATMQAMYFARALTDPKKIQLGELLFANALSAEAQASELKDYYVTQRQLVLSEQSQLSIAQQHLVMLHSVRDFNRRGMNASARWLLEIVAERYAQMLPAERQYFHFQQAHCLFGQHKKSEALEALAQAQLCHGSCEALRYKEEALASADRSLLTRLSKRLTKTASSAQ